MKGSMPMKICAPLPIYQWIFGRMKVSELSKLYHIREPILGLNLPPLSQDVIGICCIYLLMRVLPHKPSSCVPLHKRLVHKEELKRRICLIPQCYGETSYGLGCTTTDRETPEINPFSICKRNKTSNTKES